MNKCRFIEHLFTQLSNVFYSQLIQSDTPIPLETAKETPAPLESQMVSTVVVNLCIAVLDNGNMDIHFTLHLQTV